MGMAVVLVAPLPWIPHRACQTRAHKMRGCPLCSGLCVQVFLTCGTASRTAPRSGRITGTMRTVGRVAKGADSGGGFCGV